MKKYLLIILLFSIKQIKAQTWVTIPDTAFVTYLNSIVPAAMNGNQLDITNSLVTTTTHSINCSSKSIANLSGVQYFTSLTYLNCSGNNLINLPALSNSLNYLNCSLNHVSLTSLPALPNSLTHLDCSNCIRIASLPTLPNSLTYLDCSSGWCPSSINCCGNGYGNPPPYGLLNCLPILPNSLDTLICCNNSITCFPTFPNSLVYASIDNPYYCLPNYVLPAMNSYTTTPICVAGNSHGCTVPANGNACAIAGIKQLTISNNQANIYPNPTTTNFNIETNSTDKQTLQIFDVNGNLVLTQTITCKTNIDASNLAEGVYNLSLINTSGVVNKRLVIVK